MILYTTTFSSSSGSFSRWEKESERRNTIFSGISTSPLKKTTKRGVGIGIKNNYTNTVKSYIDNSVIDTTNNIFIDADSIIKANNWIVSVAGTGQGASLVIDVILNNVLSNVDSGIKNSNIKIPTK